MFENFALNYPNLKVGRFTLLKGETIPLHLHPDQFGMAYVVSGRCEVKSYQILERAESLFTLSIPKIEILEANDHAIITPVDNGHEIIALEDTCFLDMFAPGKSDGLLSTYLNIIEQTAEKIIARAIELSEAKLPASVMQNNCNPINIE